MISPAQLEQYKTQGFLIVNDFAADHECDALRRRAEELVQAFAPVEVVSIFTTHEQSRVADEYFMTSGDKIRFFFEENAFRSDGTLKHAKERSINKIGHALHDLDPVFDRFSRSEKVRRVAEAIGFDEAYLVQSMYIFKQPNIGGEVSCHQDSTFIYTEPTDIVGLWFALEDATIENGCLWAIPGGHKHGLKSRWVRSPKTTSSNDETNSSNDATSSSDYAANSSNAPTKTSSNPTPQESVNATSKVSMKTPQPAMMFEVYDAEPWPETELVPLEVTKGSLILLNGLLPHRSFENRSPRSRQAYTLHLMHAGAKYPADNWLQRSAGLSFRGF